jgi:hypothetical protein
VSVADSLRGATTLIRTGIKIETSARGNPSERLATAGRQARMMAN